MVASQPALIIWLPSAVIALVDLNYPRCSDQSVRDQVLFLCGMHDMGEIRIMFSAEVYTLQFENKSAQYQTNHLTFSLHSL